METPHDRIILVRVSAGARTEDIEELDHDILKIRVQTPPEKGRANKRVAALIAEYYKIPISKVTLLSGGSYREKRFLLEGTAQHR